MNLHLIRASAGTGKTERLSELVLEAVSGKAPIRLEGLFAVTYTTKAAGELRSRLRRKLAKDGRYDEAQRLPLSYVGTVHAVCKRLLDEFSIAAGLPPALEVLPETLARRALAEAMEGALTAEDRARLDQLCVRLQPNIDAFRKTDWMVDARNILELARTNRIEAGALAGMGTRAFEAYVQMACPGQVHADGDHVDEVLFRELAAALTALGEGDGTDKTTKVIKTLRSYARRVDRSDELAWSDWFKLAVISPAVKSEEMVARLCAAAAAHRDHPRFRDDLREYTTLLYRAAAEGLTSYARWKVERRYLDYTDMEAQALSLLDQDVVKESLAARIDLLVVDEFQDTSPLQLALFTKLAALGKRAVWVGDRKQSIYTFRGADPSLMDAVIDAHTSAGGVPETLGTSYRSRRPLVDFASELFARALAREGYSDKEVRVDAHRKDTHALPPLGLFALEAKAQKDETQALAEGIRLLLEKPEDTPVVDRGSGALRPLRASDVAVLVCTNGEALELSKALGQRNIATIVPRAGLLQTPVGTLLHAGLRLVVDSGDSGARAIASALRGWDGQDPDAWLEQLVRENLARIEAKEKKQPPAPRPADPLQQLAHLSPSECVDALIAHWQLPKLATRWPDPELARANLEAMRVLAAEYEGECLAERTGGSLVGLLRFLEAAEGDAADGQHAGGADAVEIATYHRTKGLEWPVVIAWSLDQASRGFGPMPSPQSQRLESGGRSGHFQPVVESDAGTFDPADPLAGRWIRFYPWPYGATKTGDLVESVAQSQSGRAQIASAAREALRLLYVGVTRARDHLILAVRAQPPTKKSGGTEPTLSTAWLDTLHDGRVPLVQLPSLPQKDRATAQVSIAGSKLKTDARIWRLRPGTTERLETPTSRQWFADVASKERPRFYIAPSRANEEWPELGAQTWDFELHDLGGKLALDLKGRAMDEVGTAVHAFFAADPMDADRASRVEVAKRILATRGYLGLTRPEELVEAHERLRRWVDGVMPSATWAREVPVSGSYAQRHVRGAIDLLVTGTTGSLIVDHKSFPGTRVQAMEKVKGFVGQLGAYARIVGGTPRLVVHMPVGGFVAVAGRRK